MLITKIYGYNSEFDRLYLRYSLETIGIPLLAGNKLNIYTRYLIYKNNKVIGMYFGKWLDNRVFIILQFYLLPRYRLYLKQVMDKIFTKYPIITTNANKYTASIYEKHNIAKRIVNG